MITDVIFNSRTASMLVVVLAIWAISQLVKKGGSAFSNWFK